MLAPFADENGSNPPDFAPIPEEQHGKLDQKKLVTCPHCGGEFSP